MPTQSLDALQQQIEHLLSQLTDFQEDYDTRQEHLKRLNEQKNELSKQLRQIEDDIQALERGATPGKSSPGVTSKATSKKSPTKNGSAKKLTTTKRAASKAKSSQTQPLLRDVVIGLLTKARKPLPVKELADQALATGYQTKSKYFPAVVQDLVSKMPNVERIPKEGYQLVRG